jgi:hypothetical protein
MSILLDAEIKKISTPLLVACEGMGDARFICELIKHRGIENCSVGCPSEKGGHGNGVEAIPKYLKSVRARIQAGLASLTGVLVVADSDLCHDDCFKLICKGLESAQFPKPKIPFSIEGEPIKTGVFIIPGKGKTGTLEHLLWDAVIEKNPSLEQCVQTFCQCAGDHISSATENQKAKMRMSSLVAACCKKNPWASANLVWKDAGNPIPIGSSRFKEISDFLISFAG